MHGVLNMKLEIFLCYADIPHSQLINKSFGNLSCPGELFPVQQVECTGFLQVQAAVQVRYRAVYRFNIINIHTLY